MPDNTHYIEVEQLVVGLYIHLDRGWSEHPFTFNSFRIRDQRQLDIIRKLGIERVRWEPARSDARPAPAVERPADDGGACDDQSVEDGERHGSDDSSAPSIDAEMQHKERRVEQLRAYRQRIEQVESAFINASRTSREVVRLVNSNPVESVERAQGLVSSMAVDMVNAPEIALQLVSGKQGNLSVYSHALNVSILALVFARELGFAGEDLDALGLGAMLHDIGLSRVPSRVVSKRQDLTRAEEAVRRQHCEHGVAIGKRMGLAAPVLDIIQQHHEFADGSGYPQGLAGADISEFAQLVGIVNHYESLCNPLNSARSLTPHKALSLMYAKQTALFRPDLLQAFIRFMGVYPPGCVVALSNDGIGMVIKAYASNPLRPTLILYDEDVPRDEAIILDLRDEPDVNISKVISPVDLPAAIFDYLSPQERVNYYFDTA